LHSPLGVRLAFSIGVRERHAQWPYRELYQRTCASLAEEPFTSGGWPTALAPDRLPEPKVPPPLRSPTSVRSTATNAALAVRGRAEKEDVAVIRRHVLDDPSNPVFEVVDRSAVERAVGDFDLLSEPHKLQLYGVLTAAIWLGGREITLSPV
jgi:hypothetical protein